MSCISRFDFDLARAMRYMEAKHLSRVDICMSVYALSRSLGAII